MTVEPKSYCLSTHLRPRSHERGGITDLDLRALRPAAVVLRGLPTPFGEP
jgi:hypothetical protein